MQPLNPSKVLAQAAYSARSAEDWYWASMHLRLIATGQAHDAVAAHAMYDAMAAECPALAEQCGKARAVWQETEEPPVTGPCTHCGAASHAVCRCDNYQCRHERVTSGDGSTGVWMRCRFCNAVRHRDYQSKKKEA